MEDFNHILLFKTNCETAADKVALQLLLGKQDGIEEWNLDQEDCDCVLRIITYTVNYTCIIKLLNHHGYECCELI
ncbi:hypothetical protein [Mucilaginibacter sp.]|uniref:hypothetical protein n=1 Tax=Mucilaginibacter sp. TaxID=1882438 RepID=UPI002610ADD7|nr:hypothetical protein [Mucilaginibacter sp.]MDB4920086.1 hypothetical protein [Mucilaginibacter sp.]